MEEKTFWEQAETLTSEKQMRECFSALNLIGRKIKNIKISGYDYSKDEDLLEDQVYTKLDANSESLAKNFSDFDKIPDDFKFNRYAEIDEPVILTLDDGRKIELCADELANEFYVSVNKMPDNAEPSINYNNIDGNILFSSCLNKTITAVGFKPIPDNIFYQGDDKIPALLLYLSDGSILQINGEIDFCEVCHTDKAGEPLPISFKELKKGLHGIEYRKKE